MKKYKNKLSEGLKDHREKKYKNKSIEDLKAYRRTYSLFSMVFYVISFIFFSIGIVLLSLKLMMWKDIKYIDQKFLVRS